MAVAPGAYSKLGYDPIKSFSPVSLVAVTPYLLVVNPQVPANSLAELVTLAKSQPGKLNYASAGNGSTTQLAMEMLNDVTGMNMTHIPFKGNAAADLAIVSNQVQVLFGSMPALLQHAKTNKLRALAVGSPQRSPALPDTPTVAELGYPGFEAALWLGILAPTGTPKPIIERLNKELVAITATPDFKAAMDRNGADAISNSPEQFASLIKIEVGKYGSITKKLGIKLD
jgi:tripartite-type tricarboxylate transporter receptor subunit TctC